VLFGYIILQFLWWEILLVKQTGQIIEGKQKLIELSSTNSALIELQVKALHVKKQTQVLMVVGEGTVFLLLLLFGIFKVKQAHARELELTGQQKNFFLSITHELKTPIAATKLQLQTLQKHRLDYEKQQELIANALSETDRLNALIDNVLLASRFDSGELVSEKQQSNISELIEKTVSRYYNNRIEKGEIKMQIQKNIFIDIDPLSFPSILTNLIDNAIKYSPEEKLIEVKLNQNANLILLTVSDRGYGISASDRKKIFDKFYRAGNEEIRRAKGTGLGLYIVNYLVKQHKGKITVRENKPKGSIFEIEFNAA
jgi:K+-sensing histidine kinase KdpD